MKYDPALLEASSSIHDISNFMHLIHEMVAERAKPDYCAVELGVRTGNSTIAILTGIKRSGHGHLYSCDIDPCDSARSFIERAGLSPLWSFFQTDSLEFASDFEDGSCHLVFIDTSHEYDQTVAELKAWEPKLTSGGRILLHDTLSRPEGVGKPVREFIVAHPKWTCYNIDCMCGLGVLIKP